jgi:DNA-directed RNA polymerase subunit RPC12/RpoP
MRPRKPGRPPKVVDFRPVYMRCAHCDSRQLGKGTYRYPDHKQFTLIYRTCRVCGGSTIFKKRPESSG